MVQIRGPPIPPTLTRKHLYFGTRAASLCFADQVGRISTFLLFTYERLLSLPLVEICIDMFGESGLVTHSTSVPYFGSSPSSWLPHFSAAVILHHPLIIRNHSSIHCFLFISSSLSLFHPNLSFLLLYSFIHSFCLSSVSLLSFFPPLCHLFIHSVLSFLLPQCPSFNPSLLFIHSFIIQCHSSIHSITPSFLPPFILAGTGFRSRDRR